MNVRTYLSRVNKVRLNSTIITFLGLIANLILAVLDAIGRDMAYPWDYILPLVGIASVFIGMVGFLLSFEKDIREFKEVLRTYIVPQHFGDLPIAKTQYAEAIQDLVEFYTTQHEGGYLPVVENLEVTISVEVLSDNEYKDYNIPLPPTGYTWKWFKFAIESQWDMKPLEWGRNSIFDPQDYVDSILVMSYKTYMDLFSWRDPRKEVLLPISKSVYEDENLRKVLSQVHYLGTGRHNGHNLAYRVAKWSRGVNANPISDSAQLILTPRLRHGQPYQSKQRVLKDVFPGLKIRKDLLEQVIDGVYEIYEVKKTSIPKQISIHLPYDNDRWWRFDAHMNYVLPAKIVKGASVLWDQTGYLMLIERVTNVRRIVFKTEDDRIHLQQDRPPDLLCYPYLSEPSSVKLELSSNKWTIEPGKKFWYPGDVVYFAWRDGLIDNLRASLP